MWFHWRDVNICTLLHVFDRTDCHHLRSLKMHKRFLFLQLLQVFCHTFRSPHVGRFHPVIGYEGPQGEQRYSSTLFQASALEGGEGSASRPGSTLPPGKTRYPMYRQLGGPQGRSGHVRKISPPPGFNPRTVQPVGSRYTVYATRPTEVRIYPKINCKFLHLCQSLYSYHQTNQLSGRSKYRKQLEATHQHQSDYPAYR